MSVYRQNQTKTQQVCAYIYVFCIYTYIYIYIYIYIHAELDVHLKIYVPGDAQQLQIYTHPSTGRYVCAYSHTRAQARPMHRSNNICKSLTAQRQPQPKQCYATLQLPVAKFAYDEQTRNQFPSCRETNLDSPAPEMWMKINRV